MKGHSTNKGRSPACQLRLLTEMVELGIIVGKGKVGMVEVLTPLVFPGLEFAFTGLWILSKGLNIS